MQSFDFLIGVDGGGTGTRVRVVRPDGTLVARGSAGPSGLAHGIEAAWSAVEAAVGAAFTSAALTRPAAARLAIGLGLAGVHNPLWAAAFRQANPGYGAVALASDGYTTLLGAHAGEPGAIIAIGTGTIGEALDADGRHREVSGWGFPAGDEGSGAWLGLKAVGHAQRMLDGRDAPSALALAVVQACGGSRDALLAWLGDAGQTKFASLAPLVVKLADSDSAAGALLEGAAQEVGAIARALDPDGRLPVALGGGLAAALEPLLPASLRARVVAARGDAAEGALLLVRRQLEG